MDLNQTIKDAFEDAAWYARKAAAIASEIRLRDLDLTVVSSVDINDSGINFYLDQESSREAQRDFVFSVSRVFECGEMDKEPNWDKSTLRVSGCSVDEKYIDISGYVPPTCNLVEVEVPVDDYQIEQAKKILETKTRTVKRVVCE